MVYNILTISKFQFLEIFEISKKNQNFTNLMTPVVVENQLSNKIVPYHETKVAIPEFEFLG